MKPYQHRKEVFIPEYNGLSLSWREKKCALKASNNGKCWWVYKFILHNPNRMVGRW